MVARSILSGIYSLYLSHRNIARFDAALQELERQTGRRVSRSAAIDTAIGSLTTDLITRACRRAAGLPVTRPHRARIYSSHHWWVRNPILNYYGSKFQLAKLYPEPRYPLIIEPFAGGAGYSLRHHEGHEIHLNDSNDQVHEVWSYLVTADPDRIRSLPDHPQAPGLTQAERWLIGWRVGVAQAYPRRHPTPWVMDKWGRWRWSQMVRDRLAEQIEYMRDWTITGQDYRELPDIEATWFIDPPYQGQYGARYRHGSDRLDYQELAEWCRSRRGQVIVCEAQGASWLPFQPLSGQTTRRSVSRNGRTTNCVQEVVWTQGCERSIMSQVLGGSALPP